MTRSPNNCPESVLPAAAPITIIAEYPQYFYFGCALEELSYYHLLTERYLIRPKVLSLYTETYQQGKIAMARSFAADTTFSVALPNITELTLWWIAFTKMHGDYHGKRSLRTPSSTRYQHGVLCVELRTNDSLAIRPSYRLSGHRFNPSTAPQN